MQVQVITLFPPMLEGFLDHSMVGLAREKGLLDVRLVQLRDFCEDRHRTADDAPFGGGGGMVMKAEPVAKAVEDCRGRAPRARVIYLSPQGRTLDQAKVAALAAEESLILLCGHYEGVDQRALEALVDEEISIGDYVLSGGELAAAVLIDSLMRQLPGSLGCAESAANDSFYAGLLDFPHYTRPAVWRGASVPETLMGGDHAKVEQWRRREALKATLAKRPDLLDKAPLKPEDLEFLSTLGWKKRAL